MLRAALHDVLLRNGIHTSIMAHQPESRTPNDQQPTTYACALLRDVSGAYVLQLRPANARHAANLLTCFGGRCEPGETAEDCLAREMAEELGWRPTHIPPAAVYLRDSQHVIATFHPLVLPVAMAVRTEPGFVAVAAPPASLPGLPISPWHRLVLQAIAQGGSLPITVTITATREDPTAPDHHCNQ